MTSEGANHRVCIDRLTIKEIQGCLNIEFLDNFAQFAHDEGVFVRLVARMMAVFTTWVVSIVDANLVFTDARLKDFPLILLVEVNDEERVLEPNKEVSLVSCFFWLFLIGNGIDRVVATLVLFIDFLLKLLFRVAARNIFDA